MHKIYSEITDETNFFQSNNPFELTKKFGTPLYVYNERILRKACRDLKNFVSYPKFEVDYSMKANCNLAFLQIVRSEGLKTDAMSTGEIHAALAAGFTPKEIFFVCNNISEEEMKNAIDLGILISVDSLSQLEMYGKLNPGGEIAIRFNPGIGAGHNEKVITAGKETKFAVDASCVPIVKEILKKYNLRLKGINQHIGSLFMDGKELLESLSAFMRIAKNFDNLEFLDIGGGFGIPYRKDSGEGPLNLKALGNRLDEMFYKFASEYGKEVTFRIEPGRYISAECGIILGQVHCVKHCSYIKYIGTDIGFNVLMRPVLYNSYHAIEIFRETDIPSEAIETVTIVGNICESGDILAKDRPLPEIFEGDLIAVIDAGAYGHSMSSNYNNRLRPAEVLIRENNDVVLIRERDTLSDLLNHQILLDL